MKILQVHYVDKANEHYGAGGAIAMYRLHEGLRNAGVTSTILCRLKTLQGDESTSLPSVPRMESTLRKITSRLGLNDIHCVSSLRIKEMEAYENADVLHLHCIHGGFFSYLALPGLTEDKPAVFTLHDMWAFTGHCAFSYDCDRWKIGCGKCPYPDAYPPIKRDNSRLDWMLKERVYGRANLVVVSPSSWMAAQAKLSMLNRFPIHQIPYGVDTETYRPHDPQACRSVLGIQPTRKVLLFMGANLKDPRKGGDLLVKALQALPKSLKGETVLLIVGGGGEALSRIVDIQVLDLGYVGSDQIKAIAYSAADLFVSPTRADNLPLVLQESMACGTPMVSFRVGGVPELVRPCSTGYLAEPENAKDLCDGIIQLLEDDRARNLMRQECRNIALKEYSIDLHVEQHMKLYRQLCESNTGRTKPRQSPTVRKYGEVG